MCQRNGSEIHHSCSPGRVNQTEIEFSSRSLKDFAGTEGVSPSSFPLTLQVSSIVQHGHLNANNNMNNNTDEQTLNHFFLFCLMCLAHI